MVQIFASELYITYDIYSMINIQDSFLLSINEFAAISFLAKSSSLFPMNNAFLTPMLFIRICY